MMFGVKGQWNAQMSIGGKPFVINPSTVPRLMWFENVHQHIPSLALTLIDKTGEFSSIASSGDGVPIDLTLGDGATNETSARFNIQGQPTIQHGSGYNLLHINAFLDAMPYVRSVVSGLYEGSSSAVLAKIASNVGLSFSGVSTADSQVWLPNNKTLASFVRHVSGRGYIGANNCVMAAVDSLRTLIYADITNPNSGGETISSGGDGINLIDYEASTTAAVNHNRGYGSTSSFYDAEGTFKEFNKIMVSLFSNVLGISQANVSAIGGLGGRLDNIIRPAGNTHDKYQEALHQNRRIRSLYNTDLKLLLANVTRTPLLSTVEAVPYDFSTGKPSPILTGKYILSGRTRSLYRSKYIENLVVTSSGFGG